MDQQRFDFPLKTLILFFMPEQVLQSEKNLCPNNQHPPKPPSFFFIFSMISNILFAVEFAPFLIIIFM
jgi:hypothetical protein